MGWEDFNESAKFQLTSRLIQQKVETWKIVRLVTSGLARDTANWVRYFRSRLTDNKHRLTS